MADKPPKFEPDVVGALKLVIGALHSMGAAHPMGPHRNIALAASLLEPPTEPLVEEAWASTKVADGNKTFPAKVAS